MPRGWNNRIAIKHLWMDDDTETVEVIKGKAQKVADKLKKAMPRAPRSGFLDVVHIEYQKYSWAETDFNDALTELYDWADRTRVWIE